MTRFLFEYSYGGLVTSPFYAIKTEMGIRFEADLGETPKHLHEVAVLVAKKWTEMGSHASDYTEERAIEEVTQIIH